MPHSFSFGNVSVGLTAGPAGSGQPLGDGAPLRILLLADWSGRASRGAAAGKLAAHKPIPVDRDNIDQVLGALKPALDLPLAGPGQAPLTVRFAEMDDFHPDRLFQQLDLFQSLASLRRRLKNPATFAAAAAEVQAFMPTEDKPEPPPSPEPASEMNLLDQILAATVEKPPASRSADPNFAAFIQRIVEPHMLTTVNDKTQAGTIAVVDELAAAQMRAVLHHSAFQQLEAAWRTLFYLVRQLDTDGDLKLFLLDVTREELAADLGGDDLAKSGLYQVVVERTVGTPGAPLWSVLLGDYTFGPTAVDAALLGRIGKIAAAAGAPFLAAGGSELFGCPSLAQTPDPDDWSPDFPAAGAEAWQALRHLPEATHLGLTAPRFLVRMPYGRESDPTEQFEFEEVGEVPRHEEYLWANGAFAAVYLLGEAFSRAGWGFRPGQVLDVSGLPMHIFTEDGDRQMKPCAEAWLTIRAAQVLGRRGLMPLLSVHSQDVVRLGQFRSIADGDKPLAGRWR